MFTKKMLTFIIIVKPLWKPTYFVMLIYRGYGQLTPIYDLWNNQKKLLTNGQQIFNVFSNIANCFWKGVNIWPFSSPIYCYVVSLISAILYGDYNSIDTIDKDIGGRVGKN